MGYGYGDNFTSAFSNTNLYRRNEAHRAGHGRCEDSALINLPPVAPYAAAYPYNLYDFNNNQVNPGYQYGRYPYGGYPNNPYIGARLAQAGGYPCNPYLGGPRIAQAGGYPGGDYFYGGGYPYAQLSTSACDQYVGCPINTVDYPSCYGCVASQGGGPYCASRMCAGKP